MNRYLTTNWYVFCALSSFPYFLQGKYAPGATATGVATTVSLDKKPDCEDCPAGTYSRVKGLTAADECSTCTVGRFATTTGLTSDDLCTLCPKGRKGKVGR